MRSLLSVLAIAIALTALSWSARTTVGQETLAYADLVARMLDLERLAKLPPDGETCKQWSSWDRGSQYDEASGKYVKWDANGDGSHFIRKEGDCEVMAEMDGPGCIWRIWSALAEKGHVRIYLDGSEEPAVDLPFENYFDGKTPPFNYPALSYNLGDVGCRGQNLYIPIPYQKSCKIVADKGWGRYYQFVYTTYPEGTKLPAFSKALAAEHAAPLQEVNDFFAGKLGSDPAGTREGEKVENATVHVPAGQSISFELKGPRAITAMRATMNVTDREDEMVAARKVVLKITWDGQEKPAVWCPVGDFCGTAPGVNLYKSLMTGMTDEGAYALWYMPFATSALVELVNEDDVGRQLKYELVHAPLDRPFEGLGHFHCKWHRDVHQLPEDRWPDWTMLKTEGRGRFCGVMLHVWDPRPGWWGEGDEKFFVDGEKYPSTFGTGSEDYFGYAWCHPGLFQRAYHCQTMTEQNQGHQSILRWQIADNVPFHTSFEGCIEKYRRTEEWGTEYACTACWYLAPDGVDPYAPTPADQRDGYYIKPPLSAGGFKVLGDPKGHVRTQKLDHYPGSTWKNSDHLWWTDAKPGDKLEVVVPTKKSGTFDVSVVLTKARDYGIVQLSLDGKKAGDPIDLYNPTVVPTDPILIGTHELAEGDHTLGVEIVGANEKAIQSYMFGLDYVVFEKK
ncbi:MAG TPA: glycoside hydrolase family 172 protein [Thermoguttaceae bacterium]|nr:glycoside hydrolase family 172 protein [Thermoguttaceae bacterium]